MKIVDIELQSESPAVRTAGVHPADRFRGSVTLRVHTDSGLSGIGEALEGEYGTVEAIEAALGACADVLIGTDGGNLNRIHAGLDRIPDLPKSARAAVDLAIHDLIGRARGVPAYSVLGGGYRTDFDVQVTLPGGSPQEVARAAERLSRAGVSSVKLHMGPFWGQPDMDEARQRVLAVLAAVGPNTRVDLAAHGAWSSVGTARAFLSTMLDRALAGHLAVVQPLHAFDLAGHAELRRALPLPIVLEEAVVSATAMARILELGAADRIVLDIHRVGGLAEARRIADLCEAASIDVSVGGSAGTALSTLAHAHLAASVRDPLPLFAPIGRDPGVTSAPGHFVWTQGHLSLGGRPGLGVLIESDTHDLQSPEKT